MRKDIIILFVGFFIMITGCHFNTQYVNDISDKEAAEEIIDKLYKFAENKDFKDVDTLCSKQFLAVSGKEGLLNILVNVQKKLGDFKSSRIIEWKTNRVEGANPSNSYHFVHEVGYQNYKAIETIDLIKEDNKVKILAYNVNSDGFLK